MLTWKTVLHEEREKDYFKSILNFIDSERRLGKIIYPPNNDIFTAFELTPFSGIKVVILGQDPYHGANQAHGLAFSVLPSISIPPSLKNIYKALQIDFPDFKMPNQGCLTNWAKQGVLLLNSILTVEQGKAHSHAKIGWAQFTDKVISEINEKLSGVVFLLWGNEAQKKGEHINSKKHYILKTAHPSPLSVRHGFLTSHHFAKTNQYLIEKGKSPIAWQID